MASATAAAAATVGAATASTVGATATAAGTAATTATAAAGTAATTTGRASARLWRRIMGWFRLAPESRGLSRRRRRTIHRSWRRPILRSWCWTILRSWRWTILRSWRWTILWSWRRLAPVRRSLKRRLGRSRSARLRLRRTIHLTRLRLPRPVRLTWLVRHRTAVVVTGPIRRPWLVRHGTVEVVTGPIRCLLPAAWRGGAVPWLRPIPPCIRRGMIEDRPGRHRSKRHYSAPSDGHRSVSVSSRQSGADDHRTPSDGYDRHWPGVDGMARQNRARDRLISMRHMAKIGATVEAPTPPWPAAADAWRPTPSKAVIEIPGSALKRHITPRVARNPEVAVPRCPHPVAIPIGVEICIRSLVGRPDIALIGHVVPVAIGVQIVPRGVLALAQIRRGAGLRRSLGSQRLIAV